MDEINVVAKFFGGLGGFIAGAIAASLAMIYNWRKTDSRIEDLEDSVMSIRENFMPRSEIIAIVREAKAEAREQTSKILDVLDQIKTQISNLNVTLAGKEDKK